MLGANTMLVCITFCFERMLTNHAPTPINFFLRILQFRLSGFHLSSPIISKDATGFFYYDGVLFSA